MDIIITTEGKAYPVGKYNLVLIDFKNLSTKEISKCIINDSGICNNDINDIEIISNLVLDFIKYPNYQNLYFTGFNNIYTNSLIKRNLYNGLCDNDKYTFYFKNIKLSKKMDDDIYLNISVKNPTINNSVIFYP